MWKLGRKVLFRMLQPRKALKSLMKPTKFSGRGLQQYTLNRLQIFVHAAESLRVGKKNSLNFWVDVCNMYPCLEDVYRLQLIYNLYGFRSSATFFQ